MFQLDHIVYATKKTPEEIVQTEKIKGFAPIVGGRHLNWGTYNALFYTKTSYIEWLAVEDEQKAKESNHPLVQQLLYDLQRQEGLSTLCLRTDDLAKANAYFQQMGYKTSGVLDAERKTASGETRRWKMLFIKQEFDASLPYPFFIQWEQPDEERFAALRADGILTAEQEKLTIQRCVFHVKDVEEKMTHWSRLFSLPIVNNTLKLENTVFEFVQSEDEFERLYSIDIV